jgi:hypothetical protein
MTRLWAALAVLLLATAASAAGAPTASATETTCGNQLTVLRSDVASVPITSGKVDKERAGLLKLADDATALVAAGKPADAMVKLANLQAKVDQLAVAARISTDSAALLTGDVDAATECLSVV